MEFLIDKNVFEKCPDLRIENQDDVVTFRCVESVNDVMFPLNFPMKCLDSLSWNTIDKIGHAGRAKIFFELGATKKDYMKNGYIAEYQIIGFDHDDLVESSNGKAPITWDMVNLYKDEIAMQKDGTESCWDTCDCRKFLNSEFYDNMSDELRAIVKPVWKYTADASNTGNIIRSADYVWLKSESELYGRCFYSYEGEGHWYDYYRQKGVPYYKLNQDGEKDWNWLRSAYCSSAYGFCFVATDGSAGIAYSRFSYGVAPAFCS